LICSISCAAAWRRTRRSRIDGDDFRVEELHQRRAADAGDLQILDALLLQIFAGAQGEGIRGADQRAGLGVSTLATCS
jgi:hypothetical protein